MSCEPEQILPCADCGSAEAVSPCLNGESCAELIDAGCVNYTGKPLVNINVNPKDRLDEILVKLNVNHTSTGTIVNDTNSITHVGTGLNSDPLILSVKIDSVITGNLLIETNDGLKVQLTKGVILSMFQAIEYDADLQNAFCSLVSNCAGNSCGIPTSITATMI